MGRELKRDWAALSRQSPPNRPWSLVRTHHWLRSAALSRCHVPLPHASCVNSGTDNWAIWQLTLDTLLLRFLLLRFTSWGYMWKPVLNEHGNGKMYYMICWWLNLFWQKMSPRFSIISLPHPHATESNKAVGSEHLSQGIVVLVRVDACRHDT